MIKPQWVGWNASVHGFAGDTQNDHLLFTWTYQKCSNPSIQISFYLFNTFKKIPIDPARNPVLFCELWVWCTKIPNSVICLVQFPFVNYRTPQPCYAEERGRSSVVQNKSEQPRVTILLLSPWNMKCVTVRINRWKWRMKKWKKKTRFRLISVEIWFLLRTILEKTISSCVDKKFNRLEAMGVKISPTFFQL